MEIITWCVRHHFLENVRSRYTNLLSWHSVVHERKSAAIKRAWPDVPNQPAESSMLAASLFIEDALANLEIEQGCMQEKGEESELALLLKDRGVLFRSKLEGLTACYPFENLRAAADLLFLHGSSDLVLAKQAIVSFIYFIFLNYVSDDYIFSFC